MSECRLTPAAQRDLSSIWDFTEERWDTGQTGKYIRELQGAIERIVADPRRGRARDEIRAGYRSYAIGSHVVFYVARAEHIDVIRILHQQMDAFRHM